jgi:hypothetical protein
MRVSSFYASNDSLIEAIIHDPRYQIRPDGTVFRLTGNVWRQTGKALTEKNGKHYRHLKFRGRMLLVHRIVFRKFHGHLQSDLVVNHLDGDSLNNAALNLEQISQRENVIHAHAVHTYG